MRRALFVALLAGCAGAHAPSDAGPSCSDAGRADAITMCQLATSILDDDEGPRCTAFVCPWPLERVEATCTGPRSFEACLTALGAARSCEAAEMAARSAACALESEAP